MASPGFPTGTYAQYLPKELRRELIRYGAPWPQYIDRLPRDVQRQLFLRIPLRLILELCKDPYFSWICEDEVYWAQKAGTSVEHLRRYSISKPLHEAYMYAKYHERILEDIASLENPEDPLEFRRDIALDKVVQTAIETENLELLHYLLLEYIRADINLLLENTHVLVKHPRVLHWLASNNVDLSEGEGMEELAPDVYKAGGFKALRWLQKVARLPWEDIFMQFVRFTRNFRVVKRMLGEGLVKNRSFIENAYRIANAERKTDIAAVLLARLKS